MFEPTRLAATHLADAYAQVVPWRLRAVPSPVATPPGLAEENAVAWTAGRSLMTTPVVAFYARVPSEQQAQAQTIDSQLAALRERIADDGGLLGPEQEFIAAGYSGSTLIRPALERLRDAVAAGEVERVYVCGPDRLARKYAYQVMLVDEFQHAGVELVFLNRPLGQAPEDELLRQMRGMIAECERAQRLERSRRGNRHKARQGSVNVLCGAPYRYRYVTRIEGGGVNKKRV